ncbi:MBOAT family O-acyltransferase [Pseudobutyrivibrio sp.]|uniref:MBOAT family O-acyltransferase n=1 Tax=Pseudobutyrivibrio sp. TaxID=2014367 RepID=UPI0025FB943B|nr:MBOAT family O-acyltransferase [Pseudobutyrivibrio sp.]
MNKTKKYQLGHGFLLGMSLWFYGYFNPGYLLIIIASVAVNYLIYKWMKRLQQKALLEASTVNPELDILPISSVGKLKKCKPVVILGVLINLGIIFYFKYMDFFIENVNAIAGTDWPLMHIMLPLGISFFTFQQISFIVDTYRGEVPDYGFLTYACYVTFFPQLIAGPIVTHDELIPQLKDASKKSINWDNMSMGFYMFAMGLGKKVLIADVFGVAVNWGFEDVASLKATNAILVLLAYCFQLYFDFSGYCDMAIGLGKMLNIDLPVNFDSPYKSLTITEFWNRWHMTLSRFFTRYVYIPLGGNRKGNVRTYINLFIVFLLSGFWHGAAWTFVIWSVLNGIFVIITRMFRKQFEAMHPALGWMLTQGFFNLTLVFFRADTISDAIEFIKQILYVDFTNIDVHILYAFQTPALKFFLDGTPVTHSLPFIYVGMYYFLALFIVLGSRNSHQLMAAFKPTVKNMLWTAALIAASVMSLSGISTFLYFNF